jgi:hypothetical protein
MTKVMLEPGNMYVHYDKKGDQAFGLFADLKSRGKEVVCVARTHPERLQKDFGIPPECVIWLSNSGAPKSVNPESIGILTDGLLRVYEKGPDATVILEGMEYLMTENDFGKVLRLVNFLYEAVAVNRGMLIISLDPAAFTEKELAYLTKEAITLQADDQMSL